MSATPKPGTITWQDLTVGDAEALRDFYAAVVGWTPEPVKMGDYADFTMKADGEPIAGVCHARGHNAGLPRNGSSTSPLTISITASTNASAWAAP